MSTAPAPSSPTLRLGTRRSRLALAQSELVADALRAGGLDVQVVEITTYGDRSAEALTVIGGTGVFVSALREALADGTCDVAVHSLKDLPTAPAPGLRVAAVPVREDPRDALCARAGRTLLDLGPGARVGTGSPRRAAQLRALGLELDVVPVRGNVDTRLATVARGELDAVLLARAGLARLGRLDAATEVLDPLQMLPAPGQGALAVEVRHGDVAAGEAGRLAAAALASLDDPASRACVTAERAVLAGLEAGCTAPVGALAEVVEGDAGPELSLRAVVAAPDGSASVRLSASGRLDDPAGVGRRLAAAMLDEGAADLVAEDRPAAVNGRRAVGEAQVTQFGEAQIAQ